MKNKEIRRLYHGSDVYFDVFDRSGVRSTSALGQGYYTTPTLSKAQQYGDCVMEFDVDVTDFLDWDNMTEKQLESIKSVLLQNVPVAELERFNDFLYEVLPLNKDGLVRLEELQRLTSHSDFDVVKAKMIPKSEYPTEFRGLNSRTHGLVRWKQGGSLEGATIENLLNLTQTYVPELARHLGYKGAMYGNEGANRKRKYHNKQKKSLE